MGKFIIYGLRDGVSRRKMGYPSMRHKLLFQLGQNFAPPTEPPFGEEIDEGDPESLETTEGKEQKGFDKKRHRRPEMMGLMRRHCHMFEVAQSGIPPPPTSGFPAFLLSIPRDLLLNPLLWDSLARWLLERLAKSWKFFTKNQGTRSPTIYVRVRIMLTLRPTMLQNPSQSTLISGEQETIITLVACRAAAQTGFRVDHLVKDTPNPDTHSFQLRSWKNALSVHPPPSSRRHSATYLVIRRSLGSVRVPRNLAQWDEGVRQYQMIAYEEQLNVKRDSVVKAYKNFSDRQSSPIKAIFISDLRRAVRIPSHRRISFDRYTTTVSVIHRPGGSALDHDGSAWDKIYAATRIAMVNLPSTIVSAHTPSADPSPHSLLQKLPSSGSPGPDSYLASASTAAVTSDLDFRRNSSASHPYAFLDRGHHLPGLVVASDGSETSLSGRMHSGDGSSVRTHQALRRASHTLGAPQPPRWIPQNSAGRVKEMICVHSPLESARTTVQPKSSLGVALPLKGLCAHTRSLGSAYNRRVFASRQLEHEYAYLTCRVRINARECAARCARAACGAMTAAARPAPHAVRDDGLERSFTPEPYDGVRVKKYASVYKWAGGVYAGQRKDLMYSKREKATGTYLVKGARRPSRELVHKGGGVVETVAPTAEDTGGRAPLLETVGGKGVPVIVFAAFAFWLSKNRDTDMDELGERPENIFLEILVGFGLQQGTKPCLEAVATDFRGKGRQESQMYQIFPEKLIA
ncbi:hypothetical protein B0H17DRAFT_1145131 [Mycena rosella]|uniref:Uncharacterized protein n=1 Tax=Mycena rosella TaxID=1033263 RepID=A0AAD7CUN2_MYCRO|nr:hypothetical protein B0H17DRAFT_1145131 [Mycena rosella]